MRIPIVFAALALAAAAPAAHADAAKGKALFRLQCGICHTAGPGDGEGGQGPALAGVVGRKVAGDPGFGYTDALKKQSGDWTRERLDKFLTDPQAAAPGTSMPISLPAGPDRQDVIDYLESVKK